jgi:uncharacterized peroxidase-related enzyme
MPHIHLSNNFPGIVGLFTQWPVTRKPLNELAELLLRKDDGLSPAEREIIAAHVSRLNVCHFCCNSHLNAALHHAGLPARLVDVTKEEVTEGLEVRPVVGALLAIAGKVQDNGKKVTLEEVEAARQLGATDEMIHDTVLIAASFCMFNRYVDGLNTLAPQDVAYYTQSGKRLAEQGYLPPVPIG